MKKFNNNLVKIAKFISPIWKIFGLFDKSLLQESNYYSTILVIDLHLIGDIVLLTPLLRALRNKYPESKLCLLAGYWAEDVLLNTNLVDEIIRFNAPWVIKGQGFKSIWIIYKVIQNLRNTVWELGIEVRGDIRQILLMYLLKTKRRLGFDFTGGGELLTDVISDRPELIHVLDHHYQISEYLNLGANRDQFLPKLILSSNEKIKVANESSYTGLHLGASIKLKRLPLQQIDKLLNKFAVEDVKLIIFLSNDQDDIKFYLTNKIKMLNNSNIKFWSGNLRDFIVQLSKSTHLYAMDSGPAHIAAALNVPVTIFYGPTLPIFFKPNGNNVWVLENKSVSCRPCDQRKCTNEIYQNCMLNLIQ
jgi:ADP-heptose:LPS heptosyltransferase